MKKEYYPKSFIQSLVLIFIPFLFCVPFVFIRELGWFSETIFNITLFGIYFLALIIFYYFKNGKRIYFNFKVNKTLIPFVFIIITFQIAIYIPINFYLNSLIIPETSNVNEPLVQILSTLFAFIITAIIEEFIFRGIILKGYLINYKARKAIIISAILFGVIHLNPPQIFGAFILGLITGYIFYYSKSVAMTIILHIIYNIVALTSSLIHKNYGNYEIKTTSDFYGEHSIYFIIISLLILIFLINYVKKNKEIIIKEFKSISGKI